MVKCQSSYNALTATVGVYCWIFLKSGSLYPAIKSLPDPENKTYSMQYIWHDYRVYLYNIGIIKGNLSTTFLSAA